jgi:hypothetical protein
MGDAVHTFKHDPAWCDPNSPEIRGMIAPIS